MMTFTSAHDHRCECVSQLILFANTVAEPVLDGEMAKFIIAKVGDKFCELVEQEKEAKSLSGTDREFSIFFISSGIKFPLFSRIKLFFLGKSSVLKFFCQKRKNTPHPHPEFPSFFFFLVGHFHASFCFLSFFSLFWWKKFKRPLHAYIYLCTVWISHQIYIV